MFKYSIIFLLTSTNAFSQVIISDNTARYYLEVHDSLQITKGIVVQKDILITSKDNEIDALETTIELYQDDAVTHLDQLKLKDTEIDDAKAETKACKKESRQKARRAFFNGTGVGGGVVLIVLIVILI